MYRNVSLIASILFFISGSASMLTFGSIVSTLKNSVVNNNDATICSTTL